MESLFSQFYYLSDQALQDKNFDPSTIEDLMKFFEVEAYNSWAAMESDLNKETKEAEMSMEQAEKYLNSAMEEAMDEFRSFEAEFERNAKVELDSLVRDANTAKKMGNIMETSATIAAKKYMEAALNSAKVSMKTAWKGLSANSPKVHPS